MTILALPAVPKFRQARFSLSSNGLNFPSPLNGSVQTVEFPGARWVLTASLPPMKRDTASAWQSFLVQLRGVSGRFYAGDPKGGVPRGTALGTPLVNGASQAGTSLITDGWSINQPAALQVGDYFQIGTELKFVTATVASNGTGQATINFEPPLRASPADNAPIITNNPVCIMRLNDNSQAGWDIEEAGLYGIPFSAIEAFAS